MLDLGAVFGRHRRSVGAASAIALVGLGFAALERLTSRIHFADVRAAAHALSGGQIALALICTAGSYLALTFYDVFALRVIGHPLRWRTAALASFTSYTLSHNLGLSLFTGGSARYRIYTGAGLNGPDVARIVALAGGTFWAGVLAVAGVALASSGGGLSLAGAAISQSGARSIGAGILCAIALMIGWCARRRTPLRVFGFSLPLPKPRDALAQIAIATADIGLASSALFVLIPNAPVTLLPAFVLAYTLGIVASVVSHVPGGLGVFEAVVLAIVPADRTMLFAALIAYRVLYYLFPLAIGVALLAWHEGRQRRISMPFLDDVRTFAVGIAPIALSAATFLGGGMLLLSGSLPSLKERMGALAMLMPLPFIEASHVAASLVGTMLLLLAPSLYRRLDGAFVATRALLLAGALFSLAKGIDYEEAIVCLTLAALLQWTRAAFYRRTKLTMQPLSTAWLSSVAAVVALATWSGFFAYRRVAYAGDLWWQFELQGDAPRFMRAMLAVAIVLVAAALSRLMAPAAADAEIAVGSGMSDIKPILARAIRTDAMLALVGDKRFLVSKSGDCFLMYQVEGASWIVMGDPIGPRSAWPDLLWHIRDLADRQQGRLLLYEVSSQALDTALSMGLSIIKYGEEAVIDLDRFTLDIPLLRAVRRSVHICSRKGARVTIVPADAVPVIIEQLRDISDEWLLAKGTQEKGFSLGRFDEVYLDNFDVGIVTFEGRIVAFANLWLTQSKHEASIDLMRHRTDSPPGTMDFLFVRLIEWAKERGYRHFSLGVAPLSGIEDRHLAPVWAKAAALVFRHGERLYGFRGLRAYKEKFAPDWEPRFIAGPEGLGLLWSLRDLSRLVGRSPRRPVAADPVVHATRPTPQPNLTALLQQFRRPTPEHVASAGPLSN